jgi:hypothetical protein
MSPSTPNRLFSNEVSGLEVDHRHLDRTVEVRSRLPDTLLLTAGEQPCSNSNPGRSAGLKRARAEYGGGHEAQAAALAALATLLVTGPGHTRPAAPAARPAATATVTVPAGPAATPGRRQPGATAIPGVARTGNHGTHRTAPGSRGGGQPGWRPAGRNDRRAGNPAGRPGPGQPPAAAAVRPARPGPQHIQDQYAQLVKTYAQHQSNGEITGQAATTLPKAIAALGTALGAR